MKLHERIIGRDDRDVRYKELCRRVVKANNCFEVYAGVINNICLRTGDGNVCRHINNSLKMITGGENNTQSYSLRVYAN